MSPDVGVVVPAAGMGRRMGGVKKTFLSLGGVPVLQRSIEPFLARSDVGEVVVVLAPADAPDPPEWLARRDPRVRVVPGGETRTDSVRAGLAALSPSCEVVLIHDGARPLVTAETVDACVAQARLGRGAVAGCRATDTMKEVDNQGRITATPDRARLWHAQTPQGFPRAMVAEAYRRADPEEGATDDAGLVERAGYPVVIVESPTWNLKVTRPGDLDLAEFILRTRAS